MGKGLENLAKGLMPFWMINDGSSVAEKIEYMRKCWKGGIKSLVMHCRPGNLIPYGGTDWYKMIRDLVREGERLGMYMWLYDEDPYPSGAAGGMVMAERPELAACYIKYNEKPAEIKSGGLWLISHEKVIWAGMIPVNRYSKPIEITDRIGVIRKDWAMTRWDSRYYYPDAPLVNCPRAETINQYYALIIPCIPENYKLIALTMEKAGADGPWGALPDLLHKDCFNVFRKLSLDKYDSYVGKYYGETIPGIFTDEAKPHGGTPITDEMFTLFYKEYGYDLREKLYQLFGEPLTDEYIKTRIHYRQWVKDRFLKVFLEPYKKYCKSKNLWLVGHMSPEDDPCQEAVSIGSVMPIMKFLSFPGTDLIVPLTGDEKAPCLNIGSLRASSVKSQTGALAATSESLGASGWDITSEKCRQIYLWQMVLGIDRFFTHGFWQSNEGIINYECPPEYGPYNSIFKGTCEINKWLEKIAEWTDGSIDNVDTAIVNNMLSYWDIQAGGLMPSDNRKAKLRETLEKTVLTCLQAHTGVHFVDEYDIIDAEYANGMMYVGKHGYRNIIVPSCEWFPQETFKSLKNALKEGIKIYWFGDGPRRLIKRNGEFVSFSALPGMVISSRYPSINWCRNNIKTEIKVTGENCKNLYLRVFATKQGEKCFLAANVSDMWLNLKISSLQKGKAWQTVIAEGSSSIEKEVTFWEVPPRCGGLFVLKNISDVVFKMPKVIKKRETGKNRIFKRSGMNLFRLNSVEVFAERQKPVSLSEPYPYWQVFKGYTATRTFENFIGNVPVDSKVYNSDLSYKFTFFVKGYKKKADLILDPRCARGKFTVFFNGQKLGGENNFPLDSTLPLRIPLKNFQEGKNIIELRFTVVSAMEGLLTQLYIEGDFDVIYYKKRKVLVKTTGRDSRKGWQDAGMPYYMGEGIYEWEEFFTDFEIKNGKWVFVADEIVDNAELFLNGKSIAVRAWRPWEWQLDGLSEGKNHFRLVVNGNAANKHDIDWRGAPQGWIGRGWLVKYSGV